MSETVRTGRVSAKPYIIVALIFAVICFGGYGLIRLRDHWRARVEAGFREPVRELARYDGSVYAVAVLPDGDRVLAGNWDGSIRLASRATGAELLKLYGHEDTACCAVVLPDGRRALTGGCDGTLRLLDLERGTELKRYGGHLGSVLAVALLPDGRRALSVDGANVLRLWDLENAEGARWSAQYKGGAIWSIAALPDGRRALTASSNGTVGLWDLEAGTPPRVFALDPARPPDAAAVALLPDGKRALVGAWDESLWLLDLETGAPRQLAAPIEGHRYPVGMYGSRRFQPGCFVVVLPDGRHALSGVGGATFRLWEIESGRRLRTFKLPERRPPGKHIVYSAAVSPDGRWAISAGGWYNDYYDHTPGVRDKYSEPLWRAELLLWRLPQNEFEYWLLGTEKNEK